jgi:hypothetical protein
LFLSGESGMKRVDAGARTQAQRFGVVRNELMRRIRPVCEDMPDDLFIEMIERMAAVQIKYELKDAYAAD